jgi:hypothetical protein
MSGPTGQSDSAGRTPPSGVSPAMITPGPGSASTASRLIVASSKAPSRVRCASIIDTRLVRNKATSAATNVEGRSRRPAISLTTSVDPKGVLVMPTLQAVIPAAMAITGSTWKTWATTDPRAAPMKNRGMMKPPRHPAERMVDEATNLISTASSRVAMATLVAATCWIWGSPKVRA